MANKVFPLSSGDTIRAVVLTDTTGAANALPVLISGERQAVGAISDFLAVMTEGQKPSYTAAGFITPAATPTDVIEIQGSGTKTIRIVRISLSVESTAAGIADVALIRRSSQDTGTRTGVTVAKHATSDSAATAVVSTYAANPSPLGTAVATIGAKKVAGTTFPLAEWRPSNENARGYVLSGTGDFLYINGNGDTLLTGEAWAFEIVWTEE